MEFDGVSVCFWNLPKLIYNLNLKIITQVHFQDCHKK